MSKPIQRLTLHCFRGASTKSEIIFDTTKPLAMIFGENGSGKSTIADAIDFVANGRFGSLEYRSIGSVGHTYMPTIAKPASDLKVELVAGGDCWTGTLSGRTINISGGHGQFRARVLRRAQLIQLVEARPGDRYKVLQGFIDVANVEASEQTLRDAARNTAETVSEAVAVLQDATKTLTDLWQKEGSPGANSIEWAKDKSSADQSALDSYAKVLAGVVLAMEGMSVKRKSLDDAQADVGERTNELKHVTDEIAALPQLSGSQGVELVELLEKARAIVTPPNGSKNCPVCDQPVNVVELRVSLDTRLSAMVAFQSLAKRRSQAERSLSSSISICQTACSNYVKVVRTIATLVRELENPATNGPPIQWDSHDEFLKGTNANDGQLAPAKLLQSELATVEPEIRASLDSVQADLRQFNAIKGQYDRIIKNGEHTVNVLMLSRRLTEALQIYEDTRKKFTESILLEVDGEINRLFSIIHPNESLGPIRTSMKTTVKASVEQDATFAGHAEKPPQAYFSESHLDTLGFCVWAALAKRDHPKETVIVLDDIFTSVDGPHLSRIMELLEDIVKEFAQVIVTTHYRTWRDRYRLGLGLNVGIVDLHQWTISRGIQHSKTTFAVSELQMLLAMQPLDRQAIASKSGILLEAILDKLTLQYRRHMPRTRDGEWVLHELMSSCRKLFSVLSIERTIVPRSSSDGLAPTVSTSIKPFFDETGQLAFIRNQVGCHFNLKGTEVSDSDVEALGNATVTLVKSLSCAACGDIPYHRDGTHFRCSCKQTKMTPLEYDK